MRPEPPAQHLGLSPATTYPAGHSVASFIKKKKKNSKTAAATSIEDHHGNSQQPQSNSRHLGTSTTHCSDDNDLLDRLAGPPLDAQTKERRL
ncbi:unnamed protein product [Prunus armeniaca]